MKLTCEPFQPWHAVALGSDAAHRGGFTLRHDGRIIACGGAIPAPRGGYHLWSILAPDAPMLAVTRATQRGLATLHSGPLVATTPVGSEHGCRWLELLGFQRDHVERAYLDGVDHLIYVRGV